MNAPKAQPVNDPEAVALGRLYRFIHERAEYLRQRNHQAQPDKPAPAEKQEKPIA